MKQFSAALKTTARILDSSSETIAKGSVNISRFVDEATTMQMTMKDVELASIQIMSNLNHLVSSVEHKIIQEKLITEIKETTSQLPDAVRELFQNNQESLLKSFEQNKESGNDITMTWPTLERPIADTPLRQAKVDVKFNELVIDLEERCEEINKKCRNNKEFCKDFSLALSKSGCPLWIRLKIPACPAP